MFFEVWNYLKEMGQNEWAQISTSNFSADDPWMQQGSGEWAKRLGYMFYLASPEDTTFRTTEDVPAFFRQAWPFFFAFILVENLILWLEKKPTSRLNDSITSLSHGLIQELGRLIWRGGESALYIWVYQNYRIADLEWSSQTTWYMAAILVDFAYYWLHRACHEVHVLWAQHQVHHSSEDFNLTVGLRQSFLQGWCGFIFYLPLALVVPPAAFLTHQQFNLLYQFWIHTEAISSLGPLEWILNTPSHHRVHHGSTLYCLDKNYGGTLIIWDRIFGTFAEEREKEEIIYGLVMNQPSFNPLFLQVFYNKNVYNKVKNMTGWKDKISAVVKGPSWLPGKPWTGCEADKIDVKSRQKFDIKLPLWCNAYLLLHFVGVVMTFHDFAQQYMSLSPLSVLITVSHILMSLTVIGLMFENRPYVCFAETMRCFLLTFLLQRKFLVVSLPSMHWFFLGSTIFWALQCTNFIQIKIKS